MDNTILHEAAKQPQVKAALRDTDATIIGDSFIGMSGDLGVPVLTTSGFAKGEALTVALPSAAPALTSFTAVWDVRLDQTGGRQSLWEGGLFVDADGGLGLDGQYDGTVAFGAWARIAISVTDNGDGTSSLSKYIDGVLVGAQDVATASYRLAQDLRLLSDDGGETGAASLAHFGLMPRAMNDDEIAALGGVDADGPFAAAAEAPDTATPVRLTGSGSTYEIGGMLTRAAADADALTFDTAFTFHAGATADGLAFRIQGEGVEPLSDQGGGYLGLPSGTPPIVSVVFDTYANPWDNGANQIKIFAGTDATGTPIATATVPFALGGTAPRDAWVDYDGARLNVYLSQDGAKPATPLIDVALDLGSVVGGAAKFGFSAANGGVTDTHEILDWTLATNDPQGPNGDLLLGNANGVDLHGKAELQLPFDPAAPLQIGFDNNTPTAEFGFSEVEMNDTPTVPNPLADRLVKISDEQLTYDLTDVFGAGATDFAVTTSNGEAVAATIENGVLTLDFGARGHSDLVITAMGELGQELRDDVRIRVAGDNAFTIAVMPDTQNYTSNPAIAHTFGNMTQWIADNVESKGISFVVGVGDVTEHNWKAHWDQAEEALRTMDGKVGYSILPGNHDQSVNGNASDHSTDFLDQYFSPEKQAATNPDTFGGVYDKEPDRSANTYHTFNAPDGTGWLVLSLEFGPRDDVLRWAGDVIEGHLDHRVIIASHTLTTYAGRSDAFAGQIGAAPVQGYGIANDPEGANDGEAVYRLLTSKYPNVAMTFSGHVLGDGAETNVSYSQHGNAVAEMMMDYQNGTSNELVSKGGEGAIRLVTIDPDVGTVYTETYLTERDDYLDGFRGKEELDRDGLTGPYRGHQETITGMDLGKPDQKAQANAGKDAFVETEGDTATVTLDAGATLNGTLAASYEWRDADGRTVATGPVAEVALTGGKHDLTLVVTDKDGRITTDTAQIVVTTPNTLLMENFNDGNGKGWGVAPAKTFAEKLEFTTDAKMGGVMSFAASAPTTEGFLIKPEGDAPIRSYTLAMDLKVGAEHANKWFALLQTDPAQSSSNDADFLINKSGGIGINGAYSGKFTYDEWHRVVLTLTDLGNGNATLTKYLDGVQIGSQTMPTSRFQIDPDKGFLVFSDNAPNGSDLQTQPGSVASLVFEGRALSPSEVAAMGKAAAGGIPTETGLRFDFEGAEPLAPTKGNGSLTVIQPQSVFDATKFATAPMPGGADAVMEIPAAAPDEGYLVTVEGDAPITSYTFITDILAPAADGRWQALLQTDPTNGSDADFLVNMGGGLGINGDYKGAFNHDAWQRVALTVTDNGDGTVTLTKYLEGQLVGTQSMATSRYTIDPEKGFLIFSDDAPQVQNFQTNPLSVSSVFFADRAMTGAEIAAIGGAKAGGIAAPTDGAVQFDFTGGKLTPTFGDGKLALWDRDALGSYLDGWTVKGTVHAPNTDTGEGALHDRSDAQGKLLLWLGEGAKQWTDYRYDATLTSTDNDEIGVAFYYQDADNHYRFTMNSQTQTRQLVKVQNGEQTVLASEAAGYRFNDALEVSVVVTDGRIDVLLDGRSVFGPITDAAPLSGGTVGVVSNGQKSSIFDNIAVNKVALTAHGEAEARSIAGEGTDVTAASSFGADDITGYRWLLDGKEIATGREAVLDLAAGTKHVMLEVTDAKGKVSLDTVAVNVVSAKQVMLSESFDAALTSDWRIVDEGNYDTSDWKVEGGRLYQNGNMYSDQLVAGGPSNGSDWNKGWSPLGDGTYVLRKGTTALFEGEGSEDWKDYSVEARFSTPDNDGLGFVFYYEDPENHYKLELDNQQGIWTMVRLVDGVEEVLGQAWNGYAMNRDTLLRVDVQDHKISAFLDGEAIFPNPIEDRAHEGGTFGLYSWGSQGLSFDDVKVVSLVEPEVSEIRGTAGNDRLIGTDGDDFIFAGGGRADFMTGGAGDDVFVWDQVAANGARQTLTVTDYQAGDSIDLGDATIARHVETANGVTLMLAGDMDQMILRGVSSYDDLIFV